MPPEVCNDRIERAKAIEAKFERNPYDRSSWSSFIFAAQECHRPSKRASGLEDVNYRDLIEDHYRDLIEAQAHLERFWPDGSAAVSVHHERIGWLELDVPKEGLPAGAAPGFHFPMTFYLGRDGNVLRHQIPPGAEVLQSLPGHTSSSVFEGEASPQPPTDWSREEEVAAWREACRKWEINSGFRDPQASGK